MESRLSFQKYKNSAKFSRKFPAALWEPGNHGILNLNGVPAFSSRNRLNFITGVYDYEKPKIPALYQLGAYSIGCYCLQCFSGFFPDESSDYFWSDRRDHSDSDAYYLWRRSRILDAFLSIIRSISLSAVIRKS